MIERNGRLSSLPVVDVGIIRVCDERCCFAEKSEEEILADDAVTGLVKQTATNVVIGAGNDAHESSCGLLAGSCASVLLVTDVVELSERGVAAEHLAQEFGSLEILFG